MMKLRGRSFRDFWPLALALLAFLLTAAAILHQASQLNPGMFVYALDDAYIHMAISKNLAEEGVHGVTRHGFSGSSSSPLWTFLLAGVFALFGVQELIPLILNLIFAALALIACHWILSRHLKNPWMVLAGLLALIYFSPLIPLIFMGMEHTLQILVSLPFAYLASRLIAEPTRENRLAVLALAPLVVSVRYEGLFIVAIAGLLLLLRRRLADAAAVGISSAVPLAAYGLYSIYHGWYAVPATLLLKNKLSQDAGSLSSFATGFLRTVLDGLKSTLENPHVYAALLAALAVYLLSYKRRGFWDWRQVLLAIFIVTCLLQMQLAGTPWFFRYEAYVIALAVMAVGLAAGPLLSRFSGWRSSLADSKSWVALLLLAALVAAPLSRRAIGSIKDTPRAMANIHHQQYQVGRFLNRYYSGAKVALNDIGAANFLADIHCFDLIGLASLPVAQAEMDGVLDRSAIRRLTKAEGVEVAILYEHWFKRHGGLPSSWKPLGTWTIRHNVVCGGDTVTFYALDPSRAEVLRGNLADFSEALPPGVTQTLFEPEM